MITMVRRVASLALLASCALLASPRTARAFCRSTTEPTPADYRPEQAGCFTDGTTLFWRSSCLTYRVQSGVDGFPIALVEPIVEAAFAPWGAANATCTPSMSFSDGGSIDVVEGQVARVFTDRQNENLIGFRTQSWPYGGSQELALTTLTFRADTGEIIDADMEVNAVDVSWSLADSPPADGYDLRSALAHEAGHFIGIAHSPLRRAAMFASYAPGSTRQRTLDADDHEALCAAYPDEATRPRDVDGEVGTPVTGVTCSPKNPPAMGDDGGGASTDGCLCRGAPARAGTSTGAPLVALAVALAIVGRRRVRGAR